MADNRVEVRVGARTSELEQGMNDAEQIVDNAADNIEDTGRNIDFVPDFSSFRSSIDSISQLVTTRFEEVGTSISASFTRSFAMVGLGITAAVGTAMIGLANLTNQVGEASKELEMKDFEAKFGGFTSRISNLWDKGIQSLMNGTLTWSNATKAVLIDMGTFALQSATKELQGWLRIQAIKLARKLGFVGAETAAESSGQAAQTGATIAGEATRTSVTAAGGIARLGLKAAEAIKGIMMSAWEAMAGAFKAMVAIPYVGPILAVGAGAAAFGLVAGLAGKIKSARGGYDIPSGVNPVTQLHEEEMVLPKQHANTIRALGRSMAGGGQNPDMAYADVGAPQPINIQAWDSRDLKRFMKKHGRELAGGLKGYNRNFGK